MGSAGRVLLWAFIVLVVARGLGDILSGQPEQTPSPARREAGFPDQEARAFAALFARAYIAGQTSELSGFLASGLEDRLGAQRPRRSRVRVLASAVAGEQRLSGGRALITVACELEGGGGVRYLAVPVAADAAGGLAVFALPALVGGTTAARVEAESPVPLAGPYAATIRALAGRFLRAYLAGASGGELAYLAAPGARIDPVSDRLRLAEITEVGQVEAGAGARRVALIEATVRDTATGAVYPATYRLELVRRDRWYVERVQGALP